jgi:hypothetical protein
MPAFGTLAVKGMMEEMRDISNQLMLKVRLALSRVQVIHQFNSFDFQWQRSALPLIPPNLRD